MAHEFGEICTFVSVYRKCAKMHVYAYTNFKNCPGNNTEPLHLTKEGERWKKTRRGRMELERRRRRGKNGGMVQCAIWVTEGYRKEGEAMKKEKDRRQKGRRENSTC